MSKSDGLQVLTAFGSSLEDAFVLASRQSDWVESESREYPTFVLRIKDHQAQIEETLTQPITDVWQSGNGAVYCPTSNGQMLIYLDGVWNQETVCDRDEEFGAIWGISGSSRTEDTLFIVSDTNLFTRLNSVWQEYPMPEEVEMVYRLHGLVSNEIYICTDAGLLLWDGVRITEVEGPDDEPIDVLILSEEEMLVVGDAGVYHWTDVADWEDLESPLEEVAGGMALWDNDVFIPSLEGVLRFHDGVITSVGKFSCNNLLSVGNALLAAGAEGGLLVSRDGEEWSEVALPQVD